MRSEKTTKTVFRMLMAWNDEKEGRWLTDQERAGWRLRRVRCFGYTFERATPTDAAYRLDVGPARSADRSEYFGIFQDAGWEHVGTRGLWHYFRKPVADGVELEIHTDPGSRIANYRRLIALATAMLGMLIAITASNVATQHSTLSRHPAFLAIYLLLMAVFAYSIVRLALLIGRLRRGRTGRAD